MTYQELVVTIKNLPLEQRLALIEVVAQSLRADMTVQGERLSSLARVRGMLTGEEEQPSDDELTDDYTDYLIKKYA